jgi:hypothetical protein
MNSRLPKLVAAAVLAASVPAAASARDCDHDRPPPVYAPPVYAPVHGPPAPAPRAWREARWRERELAELRAEFRALESERARFYAAYGHRPGKVRKFERWYAARRAELESRWEAAQLYAWR